MIRNQFKHKKFNRMYKVNKSWIYAGTAMLAIAAVDAANDVAAHADTTQSQGDNSSSMYAAQQSSATTNYNSATTDSTSTSNVTPVTATQPTSSVVTSSVQASVQSSSAVQSVSTVQSTSVVTPSSVPSVESSSVVTNTGSGVNNVTTSAQVNTPVTTSVVTSSVQPSSVTTGDDLSYRDGNNTTVTNSNTTSSTNSVAVPTASSYPHGSFNSNSIVASYTWGTAKVDVDNSGNALVHDGTIDALGVSDADTFANSSVADNVVGLNFKNVAIANIDSATQANNAAFNLTMLPSNYEVVPSSATVSSIVGSNVVWNNKTSNISGGGQLNETTETIGSVQTSMSALPNAGAPAYDYGGYGINSYDSYITSYQDIPNLGSSVSTLNIGSNGSLTPSSYTIQTGLNYIWEKLKYIDMDGLDLSNYHAANSNGTTIPIIPSSKAAPSLAWVELGNVVTPSDTGDLPTNWLGSNTNVALYADGLNTGTAISTGNLFSPTSTVASKANVFQSYSPNPIPANMPWKSIDLSNISMPNIINADGAFQGLNGNHHLNISGIDAPKVTSSKNMFKNIITGPYTLDSQHGGNAGDAAQTPYDDLILWNGVATINSNSNINIANVNMTNDANTSGMFENDYVISDNTFKGKQIYGNTSNLSLTGINTPNTQDASNMFAGTNISNANDFSFTPFTNPINLSGLFENANLPNYTYDFVNQNTNNVTNMSHMFDNATFNDININDNQPLSNVTDMSYMFNDTITNTNHTNFPNWNLPNVTNMAHFLDNVNFDFHNSSFTIPSLSLPNVVDMSYFLNGNNEDNGLSSINISAMNLPKLTNMDYFVANRPMISNLSMGNLTTPSLTSMNEAFRDLGLATINLPHIDTQNVVSANNLFYGAGHYVKNQYGFAEVTTNPITLTVNNWKFNNLKNASYMFLFGQPYIIEQYTQGTINGVDWSTFGNLTSAPLFLGGASNIQQILNSLNLSSFDMSAGGTMEGSEKPDIGQNGYLLDNAKIFANMNTVGDTLDLSNVTLSSKSRLKDVWNSAFNLGPGHESYSTITWFGMQINNAANIKTIILPTDWSNMTTENRKGLLSGLGLTANSSGIETGNGLTLNLNGNKLNWNDAINLGLDPYYWYDADGNLAFINNKFPDGKIYATQQSSLSLGTVSIASNATYSSNSITNVPLSQNVLNSYGANYISAFSSIKSESISLATSISNEQGIVFNSPAVQNIGSLTSVATSASSAITQLDTNVANSSVTSEYMSAASVYYANLSANNVAISTAIVNMRAAILQSSLLNRNITYPDVDQFKSPSFATSQQATAYFNTINNMYLAQIDTLKSFPTVSAAIIANSQAADSAISYAMYDKSMIDSLLSQYPQAVAIATSSENTVNQIKSNNQSIVSSANTFVDSVTTNINIQSVSSNVINNSVLNNVPNNANNINSMVAQINTINNYVVSTHDSTINDDVNAANTIQSSVNPLITSIYDNAYNNAEINQYINQRKQDLVNELSALSSAISNVTNNPLDTTSSASISELKGNVINIINDLNIAEKALAQTNTNVSTNVNNLNNLLSQTTTLYQHFQQYIPTK